MAIPTEYTPGVCNIGPAEIARRMRTGYVGALVFVLVFALLFVLDAAAGWYLLLFFPAFASASGFVQAAYRFCYAFGFGSLFNFGELGQQQGVTDDAARRQDRAKAIRVVVTTMLIAGGVTLIVFGLMLSVG